MHAETDEWSVVQAGVFVTSSPAQIGATMMKAMKEKHATELEAAKLQSS